MSTTILAFFEIIQTLFLYLFRIFRRGDSENVKCLIGKTAVVTGGNSGIGFATCLLLASRGCKVIIGCRNVNVSDEAVEKIRTKTGNCEISARKLDLTSLESVREFAKSIEKIDILINNAGVGSLRQKATGDGLNAVMQTNYFGHFLLTTLLADKLRSSSDARVVFVTSAVSFLHNLTVDNLNRANFEHTLLTPLELYANSKFCAVLAAQGFAKKLGICVNAADTGPSTTEIYQKSCQEVDYKFLTKLLWYISKFFARPPLNAAQTSFHLATSKLSGNGNYYIRCKVLPKMNILNDEKYCEAIWKKTEELVHLKIEEKL